MPKRSAMRTGPTGRGHSTAIYFLLEAGDVSHWHRVTDASEVWHFYAGSPLVITLSPNGARCAGVAARTQSRHGRTPAGRRAGELLADRDLAWRVDAGRMHRRAGL
jgi:predicted cupin superfamily sugar epimerase